MRMAAIGMPSDALRTVRGSLPPGHGERLLLRHLCDRLFAIGDDIAAILERELSEQLAERVDAFLFTSAELASALEGAGDPLATDLEAIGALARQPDFALVDGDNSFVRTWRILRPTLATGVRNQPELGGVQPGVKPRCRIAATYCDELFRDGFEADAELRTVAARLLERRDSVEFDIAIIREMTGEPRGDCPQAERLLARYRGAVRAGKCLVPLRSELPLAAH